MLLVAAWLAVTAGQLVAGAGHQRAGAGCGRVKLDCQQESMILVQVGRFDTASLPYLGQSKQPSSTF